MVFAMTHDIISNLDEIVERLLSNHAAVMVGAGFSMNALKVSPEVKNFPSWADLGDAFYKKVNGKQSSQESGRFLNALKLAEEVQAQFGRIVLDKILQQEIPDKKYTPSRLHNKLLQLPWNDVFTTNYDTLLERASQDVILRKYDVIVRNEDLVYSEKPRIIKLHGSFPSQRPFIITEEDYRIYPTLFAPFVNTVQQSLLENALCLIGFSGNDPNFLAWIGWIRDNLGKENSSKIYLIGVFNFSSAQRMLLEKRNIIIIDFSECTELSKYNNKNEIALDSFLDYLLEAAKKKKDYDWLAGEKEFHVNFLKNTDIKEIIRVWTETRITYPGWWILPEDLRKRLWKRTDHTLLREIVSLQSTEVKPEFMQLSKQDLEFSMEIKRKQLTFDEFDDLLYLFEYNWRQEKCLVPLCLDQVKIYEEIINKYNPFPELITIEGAVYPNQLNTFWKEIGEKWLDIQLALLRYYRENNDTEQLNATSNLLDRLQKILSPEQSARYNYEKCLKNLYLIRFNEIKDCLYDWKEDFMMPIWEAKRASIWAMLGEAEIANEIIAKALVEVRKQLMLAPVTNNYTVISQEASLMFLSAYYQQAINLKFLKNENVFNDSYKERSAEHKKYKCDPFQEKRIFEIELSNAYNPRSEKCVEHTFDIGHVVNHLMVNYDDNALLLGLEFIRYLEESGIPINVGNVSYSAKIITNVLQRISYVNPYLTMIYTILYGDKKNTKYIFSRKSIAEMDRSELDKLCEALLVQLELSENDVKIGNTFYTSNFGIRLAQILPEILSRLCVKCSRNTKYKITSFIYYVYNCGYPGKYDKMNKLLERLIKTCNEGDLPEIIQRFIKLPINCDSEVQDILVDPFIYIENYYCCRKLKTELIIEPHLIQNLISSAERSGLERKNALIRLAVLWENNLLTVEETARFTEALWNKVDEMIGFPMETHYTNVITYLELPSPLQVNSEDRLKQYLSKLLLNPILENKDKEINDFDIDFKNMIQELTYSLRGKLESNYLCHWSNTERLKILDFVIQYFKYIRAVLHQEDTLKGTYSYEQRLEVINEFIELVMYLLLQQGMLVNITEEQKYMLNGIVKELDRDRIPCYKIKLTCKKVLDLKSINYYDVLIPISNSNDVSLFADCFDAIYYYLQLNEVDIDEANSLLSLITWQIVTRRKESLYYALKVMNKIIQNVPNYITDSIFYNTICGLEFLYDESHMCRNDVDYMTGIRTQAMGVAGMLYHLCKIEDRKIPSILELWKSLSNDVNEFWEVRNAWLGDERDD